MHVSNGALHCTSSHAHYHTDSTLPQVCLTSNMNTLPELRASPRGYADHAFKDMMAADISVTLSTDNRTMSRTNVTKEYVKVRVWPYLPCPRK